MAEKNLQELRMGTEKIPKLLMSMALPAMISMLVQALYNVVDSIFVSYTGESSLTAVSLAFPVQTLIIAIEVGMGIGINSCISRSLGEKNNKKAINVAEHGLLIAAVLSVLMIPAIFFGTEPFVKLFTDDPVIIQKTCDYIYIIGFFSFGQILCQSGFAILQGSGNMIQPMIGQLIGAVVNIILDPIMIFGLLGFPAMGVAGAAVATVTGQILGMLYVLTIVLIGKNSAIQIKLKQFKYQWSIMKEIIRVGVPSMIMQGIGSFMVTGFNLILAGYGATAIAVFGIYFKIQSFIFMPIFGLGQGTMPIFGYNYGARKPERFKETLKVGIMISVFIMLIGLLLFQLIPDTLLSMFNPSDNLKQMGEICLRTVSWHFPIAGICIIISNSFQAIGKSTISMVASFLRQLVILLPAAYVLSSIGGLDACWWAFLISEVCSLTYLTIMFRHVTLKIFKKWSEEA